METAICSAARAGDEAEVLRLLGLDAQLLHARDQSGNTALLHAIMEGWLRMVEMLLNAGPRLDDRNRGGYSALWLACGGGQTDMARLLLDRGADPGTVNSFGSTPLMAVAERGHFETLRCLLAHAGAAATINRVDTLGKTALYLACRYGRTEVTRTLLEHGADPSITTNQQYRTPLMVASEEGYTGTVRCLLAHAGGAATIDYADSFGKTALWLACRDGRTEVTRALLEHGADPSITTNHQRRTPLMVASEEGHTETVRCLLAHAGGAATINYVDNVGLTALGLACHDGRTEITWALLVRGADPSITTIPEDRTPLMAAAGWGHTEIVRYLLSHAVGAATINYEDDYGLTALALACRRECPEVTRALLEHGADPSIVNRHGGTPLMTAAEKGHTKTVRCLLAHARGAATVTQTDIFGLTALVRACRRGCPEITRALLEHGADPSTVDRHGRTHLMAAAERGHTETVRCLLAHPGGAATTDYAETQGNTALWLACHHGRTEVTRALLEHGADPSIANAKGLTPLGVATLGGKQGCVEALQVRGKRGAGRGRGTRRDPLAVQEAHRAYLLWKARTLVDEVTLEAGTARGPQEREERGAVLEHAIRALKADVFADLRELMLG